jgi:hypothetical protein
MTIKIKNRFDGSVIYSGEHETLRDAVVAAIANRINLRRADLRRADLIGVDLSGANLSDADLRRADLSDANLSDADLRRADLRRANLIGADLRRADLRRANLSGAYLRRADLSGADLSGAAMPGFADKVPASLNEAIDLTKDWLAGEHWCQAVWIKTPTGAYNGDCLACLHGAAVYVGGPFGVELSRKLEAAGYTVGWNDEQGRTVEEVLGALDAVREAA